MDWIKAFNLKFCEPKDEPNGFAGHLKSGVGATSLIQFIENLLDRQDEEYKKRIKTLINE